MKRPNMGPVGVAHVRLLIGYAEAGNVHAANWLRDIAERESASGCDLPRELSDWLSRPSRKRGSGKPSRAATAATVAEASEYEWIRSRAAWAAWWNRRAGMTAAVAGEPGPAFVDVAEWLATTHRLHVGASAVRTWYYERRASMDAHHAEVEAIADDLN